jgi:ATP-dependent DNA ligase
MEYKNFKYIYPPRPENKISIEYLSKFDNDIYVSQPKLNGSCVLLFIKSDIYKAYNRHNRLMSSFRINNNDIIKLNNSDKWMVLVGEYMNKSKKDENKNIWNNKFVIWDILVNDGEYLLNTTYSDRIILLDELFNKNEYNKYLYKVNESIYRVKSFYNNFNDLYNGIISIDMLEGLVLKRKNSKLKNGNRLKNNIDSQIKIRKETKNYIF